MPFVKVNYKTIYYRDSPPDTGEKPRETIILCHGLGSSNNFFTAVTPYLTAQSYRCISLDTTGSGLSSYSNIEQSVHSLAVDVVDVMDALSVPKAVMIGHSLSGMTAPHLAATWPDRISAIILIGPVWPSEGAMTMFEERIKKVQSLGIESIADSVPWAAVGSKAKPVHHAFIRTLIMGTSPAGYISLCKVIAHAYETPPAYTKVQCPALIIAGEEDQSAPLAGCEKILAQLGTEEKRMEVLQGVGHWQCVEAAEEVGETVVRFMKLIQ